LDHTRAEYPTDEEIIVRTRKRAAVYGAAAILAAAVGAFVVPTVAFAHGAMTSPGSRTYFCYKDGLSGGGGDINPINSACATAVASHGKQPLWDYFGILRSDSGGRTFDTSYIPDGQLCSGGSVKYGGQGTGYNLPGTAWPVTHLTSGALWDWHYIAIAPHPGNYRMYITKNGWDPSQPLRWSDLETTPFLTVAPPLTQGASGAEYRWSGNLPTGKTGRHIIYSVWTRSDSLETFYNCSDVMFDGGNGEVTGVGAAPPGPPDNTPPSTPGTGTVSNLGTSALTLTWPAATDNVGVVAYIVFKKQGANPEAAVGATSTTSMDVTGLAPSTAYTLTVRARDAAGNLSTASTPTAVTTPATGPPGGGGGSTGVACTATYKVTNPWPGGFQAELTVRNASAAALANWTVNFTFAGDEKITSLWNGGFTQNLTAVTVKSSYAGPIPVNGSLVVGLTANVTGTPGTPGGIFCTSP
jgi:predicted carbohydrate-binding protein with CBM5 and CBM33 domain